MVTVARPLLDEIIGHAQAEPNVEVCGIAAGHETTVERIYRTRNVAKRPEVLFQPHPGDFMDALDDIDAGGLKLIGFYHSHTHSSPYPSRTDVRDWNPEIYPDAVYFICSLKEPSRPEVRAFKFDEDVHLVEEPIQLD